MANALSIDKELTIKIESQIDDLRRYKDSIHLEALLTMVEEKLGPRHILVAILQSIFAHDMSGVIGMSGRFLSEGVQNTLYNLSEAKGIDASAQNTETSNNGNSSHSKEEVSDVPPTDDCETESKFSITSAIPESSSTAAGCAVAGITAAGTAVAVASSMNGCANSPTGQVCRTSAHAISNSATDPLKYNPLGPDIFLETGKVVGQNSTRLAGKVIVGVSAAFLVWDALDLGFTLTDLIRKKGSQAAKILRDKADLLEAALNETKLKYSFEMMSD